MNCIGEDNCTLKKTGCVVLTTTLKPTVVLMPSKKSVEVTKTVYTVNNKVQSVA